MPVVHNIHTFITPRCPPTSALPIVAPMRVLGAGLSVRASCSTLLAYSCPAVNDRGMRTGCTYALRSNRIALAA